MLFTNHAKVNQENHYSCVKFQPFSTLSFLSFIAIARQIQNPRKHRLRKRKSPEIKGEKKKTAGHKYLPKGYTGYLTSSFGSHYKECGWGRVHNDLAFYLTCNSKIHSQLLKTSQQAPNRATYVNEASCRPTDFIRVLALSETESQTSHSEITSSALVG